MTIDERLPDAFDRGLTRGIASLSGADRDFYRVQHSIIEFEMGGLSGYLYNQLPDLNAIDQGIAAMRRVGAAPLADPVDQAAELFRRYDEQGGSRTWGEFVKAADPAGRLKGIEASICSLAGYGFGSPGVA